MKVLDLTLWDMLGNSCRVEVHQNGPVMCEVWMREFNGSVPKRFCGTAEDCQLHAEMWIATKEREGFLSRQPIENPDYHPN